MYDSYRNTLNLHYTLDDHDAYAWAGRLARAIRDKIDNDNVLDMIYIDPSKKVIPELYFEWMRGEES